MNFDQLTPPFFVCLFEEDLCPETTIALCNDLIAGTAKVGPQNGRNVSYINIKFCVV